MQRDKCNGCYMSTVMIMSALVLPDAAIKSFTDTRFINAFARLLTASNRNPQVDSWTVGDTAWLRERHGFWGQATSFQLETLTIEHSKNPAWRIMVVREHWWHGLTRRYLLEIRTGHRSTL